MRYAFGAPKFVVPFGGKPYASWFAFSGTGHDLYVSTNTYENDQEAYEFAYPAGGAPLHGHALASQGYGYIAVAPENSP